MRALPTCCDPVGDGASRVTTLAALKTIARIAFVYAGALLLAPLWFMANLEIQFGQGDTLFAGCSELLSLVPGKLGIFARRSFYRMTLAACSIDVHIGFGTTLAHPQMRIGRGVYIGNRCTLGMCDLHDHVTIGSNVDLLSGRRQHAFDAMDIPVQEQGGAFRMVSVGANSWIGNSAVIMADVGCNAVVGAAAVVVREVPAGAVVVGNPARITRQREVA